MGNPGVFQGYPNPYPPEHRPVARVGVLTGLGRGFSGFYGLKNPARVFYRERTQHYKHVLYYYLES